MPLSLSILAALSAMLFWGIGDFLIQRSIRKIGTLESLAFIGVIGALGLFPFVLMEGMLFTTQNLALFSFIGLLIFINAVFGFEALKKGKLSVVEIVFGLELPATVILGVLLFKETLSLIQSGIILLVFLGIVMTSLNSFSRKNLNHSKNLEKGVLLAFLTAIGMALVNFLTAFGSREVSLLMVLWVPRAVVAIICLAVIWKREGLYKLFHNASRFKLLILGVAGFNLLAWIFYTTAVLENKLAIITAISGSYPAVAFLLGVFVNKEKILARQYLGAAIALLASFSLALLT